jgi:hypothetical protein
MGFEHRSKQKVQLIYLEGLPWKVMTIRKCQLLPSHSEKQLFRELFFLCRVVIVEMRRHINPYILPARISGCGYLNFHLTHFSGLLEDVSFNTRLDTRFQHNGAQPHYSLEMRQWLSE